MDFEIPALYQQCLEEREKIKARNKNYKMVEPVQFIYNLCLTSLLKNFVKHHSG